MDIKKLENNIILKDVEVQTDESCLIEKKKGPSKAYAIDNLLKVIDPQKILAVKKMYYLDKMPKYKLCKKIGLSHQLMSEFLDRIGPLTTDELTIITANNATIDH